MSQNKQILTIEKFANIIFQIKKGDEETSKNSIIAQYDGIEEMVNVTNSTGWTALHQIVMTAPADANEEENMLAQAKVLLELKANPNINLWREML